MPLPGLDSTGRGPHTENAQGGCLSRQLQINHLPSMSPFTLLRTFRRIIKVVFKKSQTVVFKGRISSKTQTTGCSAAAPTGAQAGSSRPVRLIKISITTHGGECAFRCSHENQPDKYVYPQCHIVHSWNRAHPPPSSLHHHSACKLLPAAGGREGMESG